MWLNRHKHNNSLVVFIHGIFGSRWSTWRFLPDLLQLAVTDNARIRSYDYYLFEYDSSLRRQPDLDPFVISELHKFLEKRQHKYESVVLIGHSQGGVLAKLYIIQQLSEDKARSLKVDLVITIGTPHHGAFLALPFYWLQRIPLIGG